MTTFRSVIAGRSKQVPITAEPLFWSVFGNGTTLSAPTIIGASPSTSFREYFSSADTVTGYSWDTDMNAIFGNNVDIFQQSTPETAKTALEYPDWFTNLIQASSTPAFPGGQEFSIQCDARESTGGTSNPHSTFSIIRAKSEAFDNPITELYIRTRFKLPATFDLQTGDTASGKYCTGGDFKTGCYLDGVKSASGPTTAGDMRLGWRFEGSSGTDKYEAFIDDVADNSGGTVPGANTGNYFYRNAVDSPIVLDTWCDAHWYFRLPDTNADMNGIFQVGIKPYGQSMIEVANVASGVQMRGLYNLDPIRFYPFGVYTSALLPLNIQVSSIEIWTRPPRPIF